MRPIGAAGLLLLLLGSHSALAQKPFDKPRSSGFLFVAPGGVSVNHGGGSSLEVGGGGQVFVYRGLGFDGDVGGLLYPSHDSQGKQIHRWTGMITLNAVYVFQRTAEQKACPFLIIGATGIPAFDVAGGFNFGGGVQYWFAEKYGLRVEFRDHIRSGMRTYNDVQLRIAVAFRK
jgi:hypothetical protein